jgi:mono/diheme cytochrome c family protein
MKNPTVTEREALALTVFMLSLRQRDVPESYLAPDKIEEKYRALNRPPLSGEQAYRQFCFACHGNGSYGRWDTTFKRFIPAVRGTVAATATAEYLESQITSGRPGTQMPAWGAQAGGLKAAEIQSLVEYLKAGNSAREYEKDAASSAPTSLPRGDAGRGRALFAQNCAGCHGPAGHAGVAPEISNPAFLAAASDAFIAATIRNGRRATAMPAFQKPGATGLSDAEIADLIAHLRSLAPQRPQQSAEQRKDKPGRPQRSTGGMP